tara:strand:+ start:131 stop:304 length:174 start_codon:yes stop_codon:yes gene_type:complete
MNTKEVTRPKRVAEEIRRMTAQELAALVTALCEDNMGSKLATALQYENLDKQFQSGV